MKKMIFRATHGQSLVHFQPYVLNGVDKSAYLIVFSMPGSLEKVQRICDTFMGERFEIEDMSKLDEILDNCSSDIKRAKDL